MGWETQIIIIAENCADTHFAIAKLLSEKDRYEPPKAYFQRKGDNYTLLYSYQRRKYLPYWVVQNISSIYKDALFTVIADCPNFIGGPAGLVKIVNGEIADSYGFWGKRQDVITHQNPELLFKWFGENGDENLIRQKYLDVKPKSWCQDDYVGKLIDFTELELEKLDTLMIELEKINSTLFWNEFFV
jgi:hypothetical protein